MQNSDISCPDGILKPSLSNKLGILFFTFIVMIIVAGLFGSWARLFIPGARSAFLLSSVIQSLLAFIFPAWLTAFLCYRTPYRYLGISTPSAFIEYAWAVFLLVILAPAMNFLVEWNENIDFSASAPALYSTMKGWEVKAAETTAVILGDSSWWGLVSGILIVGCLTGVAEEMMFRAGIQKALHSSGINVHVAVWTTALVFSILHFQFFGFFPRLILGACFGYVYYFSQSLWVSATMHAFNNSSVVLMAWLAGRGLISFDMDSIGTMSSGQLWIAFTSVSMAALYIWMSAPWVFKSIRRS